MTKFKFFAALILALCAAGCCCGASVTLKMDRSWKPMSHTRYAKLNFVSGGVELINPEGKDYSAFSRRVDIDLNATPWMVLDVKRINGTGEVKAICGKTKVVLFNFGKIGKYQINLAKALKVNGKKRVEICCYSVGKDSSACFSDIRLSDKKEPELEEPGFYIVPTFINSAYYFRSKNIGAVTPYFRKKGTEKWQQGVEAAFDAEKGQYRGSIVRLEGNTSYELKLVGKDGKILKTGTFTTWADKVKIARTVVLDPAKITKTLVIRDQGKPDAWIRYTQKPGTVIDAKFFDTVIKLAGASYVILDKLTIKGGYKHAIEVNACEYIRISNCDISGWGVPGVQRCDYNGRFHEIGKEPSNYGINMNGAINVMHGKGVVIERCYIHDSRITANSWFYSHPAGPQAVTVGSPESCVIRYNDFVGSDDHRFNDAVESLGNFSKDGGLNRDADVYGNFMIYCSDDNIELDGGQQNIRCFDNRFEGSFCGVSIQGCMTGPSYVFDNTFLNMGDEFGYRGYTLKSCAGNRWGALSKDNHCYIFNNTFTGVGGGTNIDVRMDYRNNIWGARRRIDGASKKHSGSSNIFEEFDPSYNFYTMDNTMYGKVKFSDLKQGDLSLAADSKFKNKGCVIPNFTASANVDPGAFHRYGDQPARPLKVSVEPRQINCTFKDGKASAPVEVTVKGICKKFSGKFTITKNRDFDWFEVTPSSGVIRNGNELKLQLRIKPGFEPKAIRYRGAFLVRFEDGLSRPVSVYMNTDYKYPVYPRAEGVYTDYIDLTKVTRGKQYPVIDHPEGAKGKVLDFNSPKPLFKPKSSVYHGTEEDFAVYEFEIPKDGIYYLLLRGFVPENEMKLANTCFLSLDGHKVVEQFLTYSFGKTPSWVWPQLPQARRVYESKALDLKKGKHVLKIAPRKAIYLDSACVTDDPRIFVTP